DLSVDGRIDTEAADLSGRLALADIDRLDPRVSGAATGTFRFSGALQALGLEAPIELPSGTAMEKPSENLAIDAHLRHLTTQPAGTLALSGNVAGKSATGQATLRSEADGTRVLDGLDLAVGSVTARGSTALGGDGLVRGTIAVAAGDLADLSPLVLMELA